MGINSELFYRGDTTLLSDNSFKLGVVGSRSIISYTREILNKLFFELQNFDFCIVSGGMYGVDQYAHNLALQYGLKTIVVLPQGIKSFVNSSLYSQLKFKSDSRYLLVSEYEPEFQPRKYTFLARNKLISELSHLLFVAQASLKSGSISTANHHFKINKSVMAPPYSLDTSQFQGTNVLIERGAKIYLNPTSILNFYGITEFNVEKSLFLELGIASQSFSDLQKKLEISSSILQKTLLKLVLEGQIFYDGEKYFL